MSKTPRMRTAIDVIHRAQHDSSFEPARVIIGFTDRLTAAGVREQPLGALNFHDDLAALAAVQRLREAKDNPL